MRLNQANRLNQATQLNSTKLCYKVVDEMLQVKRNIFESHKDIGPSIFMNKLDEVLAVT